MTRLAREQGIVTPYTAYLIMEDEQKRGVPLAMQSFREMEKDRTVLKAAAGRYDSAADEARNMDARAGDKAVANARDLDMLRQQINEQQAAQGQRDLNKQGYPAAVTGALSEVAAAAPSDDPGGGRIDPRLGLGDAGPRASFGARGAGGATTMPAGEHAQQNYGYRAAQNYGQQGRVVNGRAFYQNGNTWTDSTAQAAKGRNQQLAQKSIQFGSDEYFVLLKNHPEASQWLALGNESTSFSTIRSISIR